MTKIVTHKTKIMVISGVLIIFGILNHAFIQNPSLSSILLSTAALLGLLPILFQAYQALRVKVLSIDVLVSLAIIGALVIRNFEEAAVVGFLFLFGNYLEQRTLRKTRSAIQDLVSFLPLNTFIVDTQGNQTEVAVSKVSQGDTVLVKIGSKVPVDGIVVKGNGTINQAATTGESFPIACDVGDNVYAGSILESGSLYVEALKVGEDTTFGKIIELVEDAQDSKSEAERFIDAFARYYTPAVLVISIVMGMIMQDLNLAITIMVLGCPGALVIGVPVSNVAGIGNGAHNGVIFKGSETIRDLSRINAIIFDKTGTLTEGKPRIVEVYKTENWKDRDAGVLTSLEKISNHPLAPTILEYFGEDASQSPSDIVTYKGKGISGTVDESHVLIGNEALMIDHKISFTQETKQVLEVWKNKGLTLVLMARGCKLVLALGFSDTLRNDAKETLDELDKFGILQRIILSGDHQVSVDIVAKKLDLTEAVGNCLPHDKDRFVSEKIREGNTVAFIGDGINDSPSLARAHIGIAMGSGTDIAIETSDVVIINSELSKIPYAIALARAMRRNMVQNIVIALAVVVILLIGLMMSDWVTMGVGMFVHEVSIIVVVLNGMRLMKFKYKKEGK